MCNDQYHLLPKSSHRLDLAHAHTTHLAAINMHPHRSTSCTQHLLAALLQLTVRNMYTQKKKKKITVSKNTDEYHNGKIEFSI